MGGKFSRARAYHTEETPRTPTASPAAPSSARALTASAFRESYSSSLQTPEAPPPQHATAVAPLLLKEGKIAPVALSGSPAAAQFALKKLAVEHQLRQLHKDVGPPLVLRLHRENAFDESMSIMEKLPQIRLKAPLVVSFIQEEGKDDGGLSRHFFEVIAREASSMKRSLFRQVSQQSFLYQVISNENPSPEVLREMHFLGIIFAKALFDGYVVPIICTPIFYKKILNRPVCLEDIASLDHQFYDSLAWLLENEISEDLGMYFVVDEEVTVVEQGENGCETIRKVVQTNELIEGGASIAVTNENKREYVDLLTRKKLGYGTEKQMEAFIEGFQKLVPLSMISILDEGELELMISGIAAIDVEDWKRNTVYKAGYSESHRVIRWFWEIVEGWDRSTRSRLLQFVTGTSMLPSEGFQGLFGATELRQFHIQQIRDRHRLPQASTCANELWLPAYRSKQQLEQMLLTAMNEGGENFGLR